MDSYRRTARAFSEWTTHWNRPHPSATAILARWMISARPYAFYSALGTDIEILQVQATTASPGRVVEDRIAPFQPALFPIRDDRLEARVGSETVALGDSFLSPTMFVRKPLLEGGFAEHPENRGTR